MYVSDKFLGLKEALEVSHLPDAHEDKDDGLSQRPPQHTSISAVTHHPKSLLPGLHTHTREQTSIQIGTVFMKAIP